MALTDSGTKQELRKTTTQVKTATGFLSSMKTLLRGGNFKKSDDQATTPLIQVDERPDSRPSSSTGSASPKPPGSPRATPKPTPTHKAKKDKDKDKPTTPTPGKKTDQEKTSESKTNEAKKPDPKPAGSDTADRVVTFRGKSVEVFIKGKKVVLPQTDEAKKSQSDGDPPDQRLRLEWVYGYRGNDCRTNIYIVKSGEIVYFIGLVVVLYNRDAHTQRHYREHTQEIKSMAVHPNGITIATGQMAGPTEKNEAHIRVWRSDTMQTLHILGKGEIVSSVECIAFSKAQTAIKNAFIEERRTGKYSEDRICAVDTTQKHTIIVWDLSDGKRIAKSSVDVEVVCDVDFNPKNPDSIVIIGKEHIGWWLIYPENNTVQLSQKADHQNYLRARYVTSLSHTERGDLITGDSNGTIYVWGAGGNIITNLVKHAHDGPVFSVLLTRGTLLTAGRDGVLCGWVWSKNMDQAGKITIPKQEGGIRMLQVHRDTLLMGTTTNSILTAKLAGTALRNPLSGVKLNQIPLTQGHFDNLRGLCVPADPQQPHLAMTAGYDGIVCMFDTTRRIPLWKHFLKNARILCADVNFTGNLLAVGTKESILLYLIHHKENREVEMVEMCRVKVSTDRLSVIKLSADCESVAAGDLGGNIHVVGIVENAEGNEGWDLVSQWKAHPTQVIGLDWSMETYQDTYILRTTSLEAGLSFWHSENGEQVKNPADVASVQWLSHNVTLSAGVVGVWHSKQAQEGHILTLDVNPRQTLVVMGDSNGQISIYRYPTRKGAYCHSYKAHQQVSTAMFTLNCQRVITVGGRDSCVMQWLVQ